jgi:ParB family chromosome partitioning protein
MRRALGKGLAALIPTKTEEPQENQVAPASDNTGPVTVPISKIRANRFQPRKYFDEAKLAELASSIKEHGLAQPLVVSPDGKNGGFELIAGERRLRACEMAGLKEVEVIVRTEKSDKQRLALSLVENLQREDLNAIESALGYLRLMKEFQISQTDLTQVVGKSKSAISNTLRLLELPEYIQKSIQSGKITEGHARALLMVNEAAKRQALFDKVLSESLSVRDTEDLARNISFAKPEDHNDNKKSRQQKPADLVAIETSLQHVLGTKVNIRTNKSNKTRGSITIHFYSLNDFDKFIKVLKK